MRPAHQEKGQKMKKKRNNQRHSNHHISPARHLSWVQRTVAFSISYNTQDSPIIEEIAQEAIGMYGAFEAHGLEDESNLCCSDWE
jgi:hypothetical protein